MLKDLKSLFIKEDPATNEEVPKEEVKKNTPTAASAPPLTQAPSNPPPIPRTGSVDQRIFDSLQKALEENNQEGFDFLEFKNSLQTLAGIIPDESTRYRSAYATAATLGVTPDKLLQSAAFYRSVLERERDNFNKALSQQVDLNVTGKQKDVERLQSLIGQKSEQIARLTQEIAAHQEEMARAQGIITDAQTKIENTKNNFHLTLDTVMSQIQTDIDNIQKYLKS